MSKKSNKLFAILALISLLAIVAGMIAPVFQNF